MTEAGADRPRATGSEWSRRLVILGAILVFLLSTWGVIELLRGGPVTGPNLLLITLDTTRADRLGCYGNEGIDTPNLDRLAEEGVRFERCIAPAPTTLASHATILTGLYPFRHGARNNGTHRLAPGVDTLAEQLLAAGYRTGAVVSALVLDKRYGLDQGFESYDDDLSAGSQSALFLYRETQASDTGRRALDWLRENHEEPFFLWVHFFDPHANYDPPKPFSMFYADTPYEGEIAYVDSVVGELLDELERLDALSDTVVVATADHGESLGEHGEATHGLFLYDATTRVPLIVRHPTGARGAVEAAPVSLADLTPTLLELAGLPAPDGLDGVSLAASVLGRVDPPVARYVYSEAMSPFYGYGWADLRAVTDDELRYVRAPRPELYDLGDDPHELENLYESDSERAHPPARALADLLAGGERDSAAEAESRLADAHRSALVELGYVSERPAGATPGGDLPDPKDFAGVVGRIDYAMEAARDGRREEAVGVLQEVLETAPGVRSATVVLADTLVALGRREEARAVLLELVSRPAPGVADFVALAELEREMGEAGWRDRLEAARLLNPRDPAPWVQEARWHVEDGDAQAALQAFEQALELDSNSTEAMTGAVAALCELGRSAEATRLVEDLDARGELSFGVALEIAEAATEDMSRRHLDVAQAALDVALRLSPGHAGALSRRAFLAQLRGEEEVAERLYRRALEADPETFRAPHNLGVMLLQSGRPDEAVPHLRQACDLSEGLPEQQVSLTVLLAACRQSGRHREVIETARRVLEFKPASIQARWFGAVAHAKLGETEPALVWVREALAIDEAKLRKRAEEDPTLARLLEELD